MCRRLGHVVPFLTLLLLGIAVPPVAFADTVPAEARRAYQQFRAGDVEGALATSERATKLHEMSCATWRVRAWILSRSGNRQGAIAAYARAVRLDPTDPVSQNNLGALVLEVGDLEAALTAFDAALAAKPDYADALNNRGVVLERMQRAREAEAAYAMATRVDPDHATAHNNLGAARLRRGDRAGAEAAFRRSAELDPTLDAPALNLAMLRDPALDAEGSYQRLLAAASKPGASASLKARALGARAARDADAQRWEDARRLYLEALELDPQNVDLLNNVAVVEDQLGMDRFALLHLNAALRARPGFPVARNNLGIVHVHRGDTERAKAEFLAILQQDPRFHRAHYNLGVIYASEGDLARARQSFRQAARLAPRDAAVRYNLGLLARESGAGIEREKRAYEEALALDDRLAEAHLSLGGLLADPDTPREVRDETAARRHLLRFLELAPPGDDAGRAQAKQWLAWLDSLR